MLHLRDEEIIAFKEGSCSLLKEHKKHLAKCKICRENLKNYGAMIETLKKMSHNYKKTDLIADRSFDFIGEELSFSEKFRQLLAPKKIAFFALSAFLLITTLSFLTHPLFIDKSDSGNAVSEVQKPAENNDNSLSIPELKEMPVQMTVAKSGETFRVERARIETLKHSTIQRIDNSNIALADGKIECEVEKGGNFFVHVNKDVLVRVLGTKFIVDATKSGVTVLVKEGMVEVINQKTGLSEVLKKDMETTMSFMESTKSKKSVDSIKEKVEIIKSEKDPISYYENGISALKEKNIDAAMENFNKELLEGTLKDKALFEIIKIFEEERDFNAVIKYLKNNKQIMLGETIYKEEFFIKGCFAEIRTGKKLNICSSYLKNFPDGYKRDEIKSLMEKNNE